MAARTVFISSTYKDLKDHRRQVWDALTRFDVTVRGMEAFGARTTRPLDTCLAEVGLSDVYVGIVAYRLGSIEPEANKPYTLLEYERAVEQKKDILIYLADDDVACFPQSVVDVDSHARSLLGAFKDKLRQHHTVETFSTPEDLVEKLTRDFKKLFVSKTEEQNQSEGEGDEDIFGKSANALREFRLTPKRYNGLEVRLRVSFFANEVFPASRKLCQQFNLTYGFTVGAYLSIVKPANTDDNSGFHEIYATGNKVDNLRTLVLARKADLYAQLQFTEEDVKNVKAEFTGRTYYDRGYEPPDNPDEVYVPPEGKVILLFTGQV